MCSHSWRFYISTWGLPRWCYWSRTHLPMQETQGIQVQSLSWEDTNIAAHSSIFAWRIPWTEEPGGLHSIALQRVRHNWSDLACTHISIWLLPDVFWSAWAQTSTYWSIIILLLFTFLSIIPCLMLKHYNWILFSNYEYKLCYLWIHFRVEKGVLQSIYYKKGTLGFIGWE